MKENELISDFFAENKIEIADNGFSRKVINRLPETRDRQWIVLIMAALGTSLTLFLGFYTGLFAFICDFMQHISPFVLLGAVVVFPLVLLPVIFTQKYGFAKNTWY